MKQKMKRILSLLLAGIVVAAMLTACGSSEEEGSASSDKFVIPVLCPVTGAVAWVGKPASWAAEYAAKVINEQGGINGKEVEVVIYDTKFDTAEAVSCMSEVVDDSLIISDLWMLRERKQLVRLDLMHRLQV
jgi:branched-chain amino acid transport system substrate-binding protein